MYCQKFAQLKLDGLTRTRVDVSLLPLLCRLNAVKPSPKADAGRRADCSRAPVTCGAGLVLSGEATAEPAIPRQNAAVLEMTAIALNFTLPSQAAARIARPSSDQPRAATLVEAEPSTPQICEPVI